MALKTLSQRAFATALEDLLRTIPMERIRVTQLAKLAGATPQAFYYHFRDKYDLAAWIYLQDYAAVVADEPQSFSPQQIDRMMAQFEKRKTFYQRAFTDKSQNAIEGYVNQHSYSMAQAAVERLQDGRPLTTQQKMAIRYHQYGVMGLFKDWIFERLDMSRSQLAEFQYQQTPDFLKRALSQQSFT